MPVLIGFLLGAVSVCGCVLWAGGRFVALAFGLGGALMGLAVIACLGSVRRLRRAARVLNAVANAWSPAAQPCKPLSAQCGRSTDQHSPEYLDIEADVVSALVNQGARRKAAATATRTAMQSSSDPQFEPVYRRAVQCLRAA